MREQETRPVRKKNKAWLWLLVILPLIYLGVQVWNLSNRPYRTQTAGMFTMVDSVETAGVVVRQETVIPQEIPGVVSYTVEDVRRVSYGTEVARIFESAYAAQCFDDARRLAQSIDALRQAQTDGSNVGTDVNLILKQVREDLYAHIAVLGSGKYAQLEPVRAALTFSLNKLGVAVGREENYEALLAQLQASHDALAAQGVAAASAAAPRTGYFFYDVDGFEGLTVEEVSAMAPQQLDTLAQTWQRGTDAAVGKMVTSYRWYYITAVDAAAAGRFTPGRSVTLAFSDAGVTDVSAVVEAVSEPDADGRVAVTLCSEQMDGRMSGLRFENVEVQFAAHSGIRISRGAMHINEAGERGVYIKFGSMVQFRRIAPIFESEAYFLVPSEPDEEGTNEVRLYDEIIVEGTDLFDGKLL